MNTIDSFIMLSHRGHTVHLGFSYDGYITAWCECPRTQATKQWQIVPATPGGEPEWDVDAVNLALAEVCEYLDSVMQRNYPERVVIQPHQIVHSTIDHD